MLGRESAPVSVLKETLTEVQGLPFDKFLASHYPTLQDKRIAQVHLRHLDCLRTEAPSHPGPYGPRICRSIHKEGSIQSVIHIDRALL